MTAEQLRQYFNEEFSKEGSEKPWPQQYEVDAETYANVCQFMFKSKRIWKDSLESIKISIGKDSGLMFKGVELILRKDKT